MLACFQWDSILVLRIVLVGNSAEYDTIVVIGILWNGNCHFDVRASPSHAIVYGVDFERKGKNL